jgi:hypothetical protein
MSLYINCLNNFFKNKKKNKKLNHKQIRKLNTKYKIAIYNILGVIDSDNFVPMWSIPVDKKHDVINEGISYKYLQYGLSILKNYGNMTENHYFNLYIRSIITSSNIKINNNFELILLLSIFNHIKKSTNEIIIFKWDKTKMVHDADYNYKIPTISQINYDEIQFNNNDYYYKIFEIPKKYL